MIFFIFYLFYIYFINKIILKKIQKRKRKQTRHRFWIVPVTILTWCISKLDWRFVLLQVSLWKFKILVKYSESLKCKWMPPSRFYMRFYLCWCGNKLTGSITIMDVDYSSWLKRMWVKHVMMYCMWDCNPSHILSAKRK